MGIQVSNKHKDRGSTKKDTLHKKYIHGDGQFSVDFSIINLVLDLSLLGIQLVHGNCSHYTCTLLPNCAAQAGRLGN